MMDIRTKHGLTMSGGMFGFSILEVLISLAIISILAVIAVPAYFKYHTRIQISEGINLIGPVKARALEYLIENGTWPATNAAVGLPDPSELGTRYVESIALEGDPKLDIVITYRIPELGSNNTLIFSSDRSLGNGAQVWKCSEGSLPSDYRPAFCKSSGT